MNWHDFWLGFICISLGRAYQWWRDNRRGWKTYKKDGSTLRLRSSDKSKTADDVARRMGFKP